MKSKCVKEILQKINECESELSQSELEYISLIAKEKAHAKQSFEILEEIPLNKEVRQAEYIKAIEAFNDNIKLKKYKSEIPFSSVMIDYLYHRNEAVSISVIHKPFENDKIGLAINIDGKYFYPNYPFISEISDFYNLKKEFNKGIKKKLNSLNNEMGYECPDSFVIDFSHIEEIHRMLLRNSSIQVNFITAISQSKDPDLSGRFTFVIKVVPNSKSRLKSEVEYYDTFSPYPPGNTHEN